MPDPMVCPQGLSVKNGPAPGKAMLPQETPASRPFLRNGETPNGLLWVK